MQSANVERIAPTDSAPAPASWDTTLNPARHGRFGPLDAMRGIGALTVVVFHASSLSTHVAGAPTVRVPFGYLAVDMFFVLSGCVISYSYGPRFAQGLTFREFMVARIVRLYPIFCACALLGSLPLVWFALHGQGSRGRFLVTFATNMLMLPAPTYPVQPDPFPLVSPAWSLFLELFVANVSYGLIQKRLTNAVLAGIIALGLAALLAIGLRNGTLNGGWLWEDFLVGFPRVVFSFYAGVAVHRVFQARKPPVVPSFIPLAVVAATFWPSLDGRWTLAYESICVVIVYPMLIYIGAAARERHPRVGAALGDVSYALYLVHIPLLLLGLDIARSHGVVTEGVLPWTAFVVASVVCAAFLSFVYDPPARGLLRRLTARIAA